MFWLAGRCLGIESTLVGEVVNIESIAEVPLVPAAHIGLFNLRGTPVTLLNLGTILDIPELTAVPKALSEGKPLTALVIRSGTLIAAILIEKMDVVLPPGRGAFSPKSAADHAAVEGFVEIREQKKIVTYLSSAALLEAFERLKFRV